MSSPLEGATRTLGRYHLGEPLGGGPTGEVFRAKVYGVAGLERQYAVKIFHPELAADPSISAQLEEAGRRYGTLEHPRIARLFEFGISGGKMFSATAFVDGIDAGRLIEAAEASGNPLPHGASISLVTQAARAVGYAHGRGFTHSGLCPTNLLCTPSAVVKITDFGFLPPRLGRSPAGDPTLRARIAYLAPEQIDGEETSPATDVFVLGTITYELLTGKRPFAGASPADVAKAIVDCRYPPPNVPKPIAKVLSRCLSRSPLERYPSAAAFADEIDAATRSLMIKGSQSDAAAAVRSAREHIAQMRSDQMSGAMSFPMPAPPMSLQDGDQPVAGVPNLELSLSVDDILAEDPGGDVDESAITMTKTVEPGKPSMPAAVPTMIGGHGLDGESRPMPRSGLATPPPVPQSGSTAPISKSRPLAPILPPGPSARLPQSGLQTPPPPMPPALDQPAGKPPVPTFRLSTLAELPPDGPVPPGDVQVAAEQPLPPPPGQHTPKKPASAGRLVLMVGLLAVVGGGAYLAYHFLSQDEAGKGDRPIVASGGTDAGKSPVAKADAAVAAASKTDGGKVLSKRDAGTVATAPRPPDAGVAAKPDAAVKSGDAPEGKLVINSDPEGATVYLDGTKVGRTPITLDATSDRHRLALIRAGHKLHTGNIAGSGSNMVKLAEVTPPDGPAGIKVRCKKKNRYYVNVDGEDVGQLCPTERIGVNLGTHVVEIYDPVTDSRRTFNVKVKQTRNSLRVRVD